MNAVSGPSPACELVRRLLACGLGLAIAGCHDAPAPPAAPALKTPVTAPADPATTATTPAHAPPDETFDEDDEEPAPQPVFRPADSRPEYDPEPVAELGIRIDESPRLLLFSDLAPEVSAALPALIDQAYPAWVDYFGELLPDRDGSEFQITGYVMQELDRFEAAGMLPEHLPTINIGRQIGREFWLREQEFDYYRRHLLIHEATHCYMTVMPGPRPPLWYLEGMAELFGTHRLDTNGGVTFCVMPDDPDAFVGLGRIPIIQQEVQEGRALSVREVQSLGEAEFASSRTTPYAWSWGLCHFLNTHPRYQERFRALGRHLEGGVFDEMLEDSFAEDEALLNAEWEDFIRRIDYGYDVASHAFVTRDAVTLQAGEPVDHEVSAGEGWQSTGVHLEPGDIVRITATGDAILATTTVPWVSEPQGITIRYAHGAPIGTLLAMVVPDASSDNLPDEERFAVQRVGRGAEITAAVAGTLFLRINDDQTLHDNQGSYQVVIERAAAGE